MERYQDTNARTIDRWIKDGWEWGIPVSHETYARALRGEWSVQVTPTKQVPREWFGNLREAHVLGLASGGGQQMPIFQAAGANVTVIDYSSEQIKSEREVATREGYAIEAVRADVTQGLPFADATFDLVFNPVSICYMRDIKELWCEAYRVLKPGGTFITAFDTIVNYLVDEAEERIVWSHPFDPLTQPEARAYMEQIDGGMQFSHGLTETLGGILAAGFVVEDMYEDINSEGRLHNLRIPTYLALKAVKRV